MVRIIFHGGNGRLHPANVAVMIGPPNIDYPVKATGKFVTVVGNIGSELGRYTIVADNHPVFVVTIDR